MNSFRVKTDLHLSSGQAPAALQVVDLKKRFGDYEVLKGISITANAGEVISILGASGSGKSTFLRCLNFLETPTEGKIWVAGQHVRLGSGLAAQRDINALRTKLGMVFQNFNLWSHKTVLQNIIEAPVHVMGKSKKDACLVADALLLKVGLIDKRDSYPSHLSGGQQQRVAIARALAMEPQILLFDEPTSALDPELVGEVLKVIRSLADEGRTMLIVTHELGFARQVSNRTVFLHEGRVEEDGRPDDVFARPHSSRLKNSLRRMWGGTDMELMRGFESQIAAGAITTVRVALTSLVLGVVVGLIGAMAKRSSLVFVRWVAHAYTTIVRGVPELLLILMLYFGGTVALTAVFGRYVEVDAFAAGVFALTIVFGAYATEVFRGAISAVPKGQVEAAQALGMSQATVWRLVILPQMFRYALPGIGNLWLTLLKDTALISVVGLEDLMRKTSIAAGSTHDPLVFYTIAAALYLTLTSVSLAVLALMERHANRGVQISGGALKS